MTLVMPVLVPLSLLYTAQHYLNSDRDSCDGTVYYSHECLPTSLLIPGIKQPISTCLNEPEQVVVTF